MVRATAAVLVLAILLSACGLVPLEPTGQEVSFTVAPSAKHTIAVDVREGRRIVGSFTVSGQENYMDFYIKDPNGGLAYGVVRAQGSHSFEAQAETTGAHTLYFDNSISFGSGRNITLRYDVR